MRSFLNAMQMMLMVSGVSMGALIFMNGAGNSAIHEIEALLCFLIAAVAMVGLTVGHVAPPEVAAMRPAQPPVYPGNYPTPPPGQPFPPPPYPPQSGPTG